MKLCKRYNSIQIMKSVRIVLISKTLLVRTDYHLRLNALILRLIISHVICMF